MSQSGSLLSRLAMTFGGAAPRGPRRLKQSAPQLDRLEDRVVLSRFGSFGVAVGGRAAVAAEVATATDGSTGLAALCTDSSTTTTSSTGASTSTSTTASAASRGLGRAGRRGVQDADLTAHLQQLQTDINSVLSGSAVTDAQRLALRTDLRAIADAGFKLDRTALATVVDSLLTTLADGTYDSDATVADANRTAFNNLFTDSGLNQTLIDRTYTDIVAVARNLNISTEELSTLSADRAAIQADLTRLGLSTAKGFSQSNLDLIIAPGVGFGRRGRGRF